jgi:hypothetical protein
MIIELASRCALLFTLRKGKDVPVLNKAPHEEVTCIQISATPSEEVEVELHALLTSALDGGEWSALLPGRFTHGERNPGTHWIGGWVGPRAGLNTVTRAKRHFSAYAENRTPVAQPLA